MEAPTFRFGTGRTHTVMVLGNCRFVLVLFPLILVGGEAPGHGREEEMEALRALVSRLEARIAALENGASDRSSTPDPASARTPPPAIASTPQEESFSEAPAAADGEAVPADASVEPDRPIAFTGALRYNLFATDATAGAKKGESGLDLFRIGAAGAVDNLLISAEYRFYPYMNTIHHGWIGWDWPKDGRLQVGVSQVPFGILPYAAHNYWFGIPYYLGLADDYDLGVQYIRDAGPWDLRLAFFKNGELGNAADLERYSFDLVRTGDHANEEINQFNIRLARTLGSGPQASHEIGLSLQGGQVYNALTGDNGNHWAIGAHLDSRFDRWNLQFEVIRYGYDPENPLGMTDDTVRLGAFAASYDVASHGTVGVANVAYNLPVSLPGIQSILVYNDFSILWKDDDRFRDSILNTTGAAVGIGPLFLYLDWIAARNMVFFDGGSLAGNGNDHWSSRLNLNVGYYW